jgi:hypothetical protein
MPTPFPGMDPYLERPALWPDCHNRLIVLLANDLAPRVRPRYYVAIEERTYTTEVSELLLAGRAVLAVIQPSMASSGLPEEAVSRSPAGVMVEVPLPEEVRETFLEVRTVEKDRLVTVLEILSPTNKRMGEGREQYLRKRRRVLGTATHLVEIDLLRDGEPMPIRGIAPPGDYRILLCRHEIRPGAELIAFTVRTPIPTFPLPLLPGDPEPSVDLNRLFHELFDVAAYDLRIDYRGNADPPLEGEDAVWADSLLRETGQRA